MFLIKKDKNKRGFSLIELLVSVGVFTVITSIILANHARFGGDILVSNLAYDVALSIRQSQLFGLSVREFKLTGGGGRFDIGYGVHLSTSDLTSYIIYADFNGDKAYQSGADEIEETFNLRQGFKIKKFCATQTGGTEDCSDVGAISTLNLTFVRPDPDATISVNGSIISYRSARIVLESSQGTQRSVLIESTGQ
ncbi:MAG: prepilin-type N-terminal cleavage/methylation domain-containing protein, partial [Candidatus Pacebacteria bacterium]|nr:prepilin-type N-terminal cleavage/methylation domain-containing protein [Candidatus Paceibacterota bacterium]